MRGLGVERSNVAKSSRIVFKVRDLIRLGIPKLLLVLREICCETPADKEHMMHGGD